MRIANDLESFRDLSPTEQFRLGNAAIGVGNAVAKIHPDELKAALRRHPLLYRRLVELMLTSDPALP